MLERTCLVRTQAVRLMASVEGSERPGQDGGRAKVIRLVRTAAKGKKRTPLHRVRTERRSAGWPGACGGWQQAAGHDLLTRMKEQPTHDARAQLGGQLHVQSRSHPSPDLDRRGAPSGLRLGQDPRDRHAPFIQRHRRFTRRSGGPEQTRTRVHHRWRTAECDGRSGDQVTEYWPAIYRSMGGRCTTWRRCRTSLLLAP
jgi:hypothetical protein